jgi:hypothetical protein
MNTHDDYRKAAEALVDAATTGLCLDGSFALHPVLRNFLVDELVENPALVPHLFKDDFIKEFLEQIVIQSDTIS